MPHVVLLPYMEIHTGISLQTYTTMRLGGKARFMAEAHSPEDMMELCERASGQQLPIFILGGGSNTIARDEGFNGLVIRNRIMGWQVIEDTPSYTAIKIGGGENWDETVRKTVELRLSGIEALSAIPGTVGAAPVQNIGAYGQEVSEAIEAVDAYHIPSQQFVTLSNDDCGFSYRHSIFRGSAAHQYAIVAVTIRLSKNPPEPPFYTAIENYFEEHHVSLYSPQIIRDAVVAIRADKLPDPQERPNTGSFFKNAIIDDWLYQDIMKEFPDMPAYDMPNNQHKVPTGWLIEQVGLKGKLLHGMRIHDKNALVLINESATSYADLAAARQEIIQAVRDMFRIGIEQEPLEI